MRTCPSCGHVFFTHDAKGCRTCGCTDVRGALFNSDMPADGIALALGALISQPLPNEPA
jgi:hypothetical protein